jgi:hypothetical protein
MQHVVIGAGQVGSAIAQVLGARHQVHLRDVERSGPTDADTLHICFPWSAEFAEQVKMYRRTYDPDLVVVHSTVPIGTCAALDAVHSPVRGRHPFLAQGIRTFVKFFGGPRAVEAAAPFIYCGVEVRCVPEAATTEAGKLWELVQYGLQIVIEKQMYSFCQKQGLDFDVVYTEFARTYNQGYALLGEDQFRRPVIAHVPGPIGGHCVLQNGTLLPHALAEFMVRAGGG